MKRRKTSPHPTVSLWRKSIFNLERLQIYIHYLGWVQYCSNTEYLSRLKLKSDSDSLLAGSGLHQIEFDLVQPHGAYSVYSTAVRTPYWKFLKRGMGRKLFSKKFLPKSSAQTNLQKRRATISVTRRNDYFSVVTEYVTPSVVMTIEPQRSVR